MSIDINNVKVFFLLSYISVVAKSARDVGNFVIAEEGEARWRRVTISDAREPISTARKYFRPRSMIRCVIIIFDINLLNVSTSLFALCAILERG